MENKFESFIDSPVGVLKLGSDGKFLTEVTFTDKAEASLGNTDEIIEQCQQQLFDYFEGKLETFNLPLKPKGTPFQETVWNKLIEIPFGKTISYKDLSIQLGDEKKIRAAASANGKNPIAIIIPCHRVIGSDGSLTGYAGGLERKKWLLLHEKAIQPQNEQLSIF